jgi:hypothetical protein
MNTTTTATTIITTRPNRGVPEYPNLINGSETDYGLPEPVGLKMMMVRYGEDIYPVTTEGDEVPWGIYCDGLEDDPRPHLNRYRRSDICPQTIWAGAGYDVTYVEGVFWARTEWSENYWETISLAEFAYIRHLQTA